MDRIGWRTRGTRQASTPSGIASTVAAASDSSTSIACSYASLPKSGEETPAAFGAFHGAAEELAGDCREAAAVEFGLRVELDHALLIDRASEPFERGPGARQALRQIQPIQQHCVVRRKESAIVLQHAQLIAADLGVGGVGVDHVYLAGNQRFVGKPVVEAARHRVRESVRGAQSGPAVGAPDEFLRQPENQRGMRRKIGNAANAMLGRPVFAHGERIRIVEAKRYRDAESVRRECTVQPVEVQWPRAAQDLALDGARVLGVDVDLAARQRREHDAGVAEPGPVYRTRFARLSCGLRHDLAEYVRLGKTLRADIQCVGGGNARRQQQCERKGEPLHPAPPASASSGERCARMKSVT
jgi:hypothetical protein